jgi:hypothetical protein
MCCRVMRSTGVSESGSFLLVQASLVQLSLVLGWLL